MAVARTDRVLAKEGRDFLFQRREQAEVTSEAAEFAGHQDQRFTHAGGESAIGLHGENHGALADEFKRDGAGVELQFAAAKAEIRE